MLYEHGGQDERAEMAVAKDGLPALVIEVLSHSTWEYDVDARDGKAWGFLQLGVPLYLVFDPHADLQGEPCRGWRQDGRQVRTWLTEPDDRYHVPRLGISFQPEDSLLRVYDQDGQPVPFDFELDLRLRVAEEDRDLQAQRAETERQRADDLAQRIAALEAELARLRQQE
jgi:Uma2 family endonuclease